MKKRIRVKPNKTQATFSVLVGVVFCCIGLFIAIPMAGLFGIFWTAIAFFITYSAYRNGFTDHPMNEYELHVDDIGSESIEGRLKQLDSLYNQGLITREEYDEKRKDILNKL